MVIDFITTSFLIPLLPLMGAAVNGLIAFMGWKAPRRLVSAVGCGSILASFLLSSGVCLTLAMLPVEWREVSQSWFEWIRLPILSADVAFLLDPLSAVMMLVVTGVGLLIHLYAVGYMRRDPGYARFFAFFNLFCFAMLLLVMADNLLLMFVGWEGVGLCSYLLIGFWHEHEPNAAAGMKAFVVNRIGDAGLLVGLMILLWAMWTAGHPTLGFLELQGHVAELEGITIGTVPVATAVALCLFVGAAGKSAQLPLFVWLPDAMAGPTPVSALIHAATMVTAGVYMVGRMHFLYAMSPAALAVVAAVGAATALFAATIGFAQNDIKRVLAYSTVSQLGMMFLGMGTGMYAAGIFHLVTHAFFKACLFLGAGSVILGMHHEQDIQRMGGLKRQMPITHLTFLVAAAAICGIFPLSGFFSKDEILWQAFARGASAPLYFVLWGVGLAAALATAFYMARLVVLVFYGAFRGGGDPSQRAPHESRPIMTGVLMVLAILSAAGGLLGVPAVLGGWAGMPNLLEGWLEPVWGASQGEASSHGAAEILLMVLALAASLAGVGFAWWLYLRKRAAVASFVQKWPRLFTLVRDKYYVDEIYDWAIVQRLLTLTRFVRGFDDRVVDALVNLSASAGVLWSRLAGWWDDVFVNGAVGVVASATVASGRAARRIHTGRIQHYMYLALAGVVALLLWRLG